MNMRRTFQIKVASRRAHASPRIFPSTVNSQPSTPSEGGLSLIEILVTVALLVVIILGLTAMFDQTRKAFTVGLGNVDYQDAGRTAMDLITRDLQQMTPTYYSTYNYEAALFDGFAYQYTNGLNFYSAPSASFRTSPAWPMSAGDTTNFSLEDLYFTTGYNHQLSAIGYRLSPSDVAAGVGTLYRFSSNSVVDPRSLLPTQIPQGPVAQLDNFRNYPSYPGPSMNRVVDGVVDFRIQAFDRNGLLIPTPTNVYFVRNTNPFINPTVTAVFTGNASFDNNWWNDPNTDFVNTNVQYIRRFTGDYTYLFYSNAVPAYVEVELGIMESPTYARLQALTNTILLPVNQSAYWNFLTNHAGQVHIFRQRITIPAADPAAYP
jgi:hypothetical protein